MTKNIYDQMRKAHFKEEARVIVSNDRDARKYGRTVDTAGNIARAMERAYKLGKDDQTKGEPFVIPTKRRGALHWPLIPPSSRRAFQSLCFSILGSLNHKPAASIVHHILSVDWKGTRKWALCTVKDDHNEFGELDTWGEKSIKPLIRDGLLEYVDGNKDALRISKKGEATWWEANEQKTIEQFLY